MNDESPPAARRPLRGSVVCPSHETVQFPCQGDVTLPATAIYDWLGCTKASILTDEGSRVIILITLEDYAAHGMASCRRRRQIHPLLAGLTTRLR